MIPVRPGTMSSTLAIAAAQSAARDDPLSARLRVECALREQKRGEGHEHIVRDVRLPHDGIETRSLEPLVAGKHTQPIKVRHHERHEHRREERRDAALAPDRFTHQVDQRGDEQEPQRSDQRIEHVLRRTDRIQRSGDEQRKEGERHPRDRIAANRRELAAIPPPASQKNRITPRRMLSTATEIGIEHPSRTAAHLRRTSARSQAARKPGIAALGS